MYSIGHIIEGGTITVNKSKSFSELGTLESSKFTNPPTKKVFKKKFKKCCLIKLIVRICVILN